MTNQDLKPNCTDSLNEKPKNTVKIMIMCCDSRGEDCPYRLPVEHKDVKRNIHFQANLCVLNCVG